MKFLRMRRRATVALAVTSLAVPGWAQTSALPAVTVAGQRFKIGIPAEEVPQTVSSITAVDIDARAYKTVEEALGQISSVQPGLAGRVGYDEFMIRGFFQSAYQFKNGLRLDPGYNQQEELYGLERIDVLKGPSSVEYGQIAPGGVVSMISKRPQRQSIREAGVEFGSFGFKRLTADYGDTLDAAGVWSLRVPVAITDSGDFQDYVFSKRQYVAPTLAYRPDARTELVLFSAYQNDEFRRSVGVPFELSGKVGRSTYLGEPSLPTFTRPQTQLGYALEHRTEGDWVFRQNLRQMNYHERGTSIYGAGSTDTTFTPGYYYFDYKVSVLSLDNQLQKAFKAGAWEHNVMAGYDLLRYSSNSKGVGGELPALDIAAPVYSPTVTDPLPEDSPGQTLRQQGLYGQYRLKLSGLFGLNLGARHSKVTNDNYGVRTAVSKNTYNAGLMAYDVGGFSPFASYSQSFEPINGWDPYLYDGSRPPQFSQGSQREAGVKWRSADGRQTLVASYFDIYQTNVYNYVGFGTAEGCAVDDAACDAPSDQRHRGIELELNSRWGRSVDLQFGYTHLSARIAKTPLPQATGAVGARPFGIPADTVTAAATLRGAGLQIQGLDVTVGLRHVGDRLVNQGGGRLPAYTTLDLAGAYTRGPIKLTAAVKNLTDKGYFLGPYFGNVNYGAPRSLSVSLQVGW